MSTPRSFKKLRRRIRSPFTLLKKLFNKLNKQTDKHQVSFKEENRACDNGQQPVHAAPENRSGTSPEILIPPSPSSYTSSDSDSITPPTPSDVTPNTSPVVVVPFEEPVPFKIARPDEPRVIVTSDIQTLIQSLETDGIIDSPAVVPSGKKNARALEVKTETVRSIERTQTVKEDMVAVKELKATPSFTGPAVVEKIVQTPEITAKSPTKDLKTSPSTEIPLTPCSTGLVTVEKRVPDLEIVTKPLTNEKLSTSGSSEISSPTVIGGSITESHPTTVADKEPLKRVPESPPSPQPSSPVSTHTRKDSTPSTPRKRVVSTVQDAKDTSVMDEIQASVRSREKRRLERERIEAEEKAREERELRRTVVLDMDVTELGVRKTEVPVDPESVRREVRTWRKQRESTMFTKVKDDEESAKIARYRETMSQEEIISDLMTAVQKRASRAPCYTDPREKRQTVLLEDLFARRVQVG